MRSEVAVRDAHVVEERVDPEELLDVLVHVLGVGLEQRALRVEGLGEVLERNVVVGRGVKRLVGHPCEA